MPRSDDPFDRLRAAIDELAAADAADLLTEARIEARARIRSTLTDALAHSMLEHLHDQLPPADAAPDPPVTSAPEPAPEPPVTSAPEPEAPRVSPAGPAWYVYGVVGADAKLPRSLPSIDPGQPVTTLREGALAVVASQVPLEEFDETHLREHLADMAWVEAIARAHEAVLDAVRERTTVVPMRMCTVYRTEGGAREMLSREAEALEAAIGHLAGKAEWGVKAFRDLAPAGGRIRDVDTGGGDSSGAAYMERQRTARERRQQALELANEATARVHDRLSEVSADADLIPLQRPEVSGHTGEMMMNGVYLVADEALEDFHAEVRALQAEFEPAGIELVATGPWPAYNFVPGTIGAPW